MITRRKGHDDSQFIPKDQEIKVMAKVIMLNKELARAQIGG